MLASRRAAVLILTLALALSGEARAHHVVSELGIEPVEPSSRVEAAFTAAGFALGSRSGTWQLFATTFEYAFTPSLSATLFLPFARVSYDDGETAWGLGDVELAGKLRLYASEHGELISSVGLASELPTGDAGSGIGGGHVELTPFALVSSQLHRSFLLFAVLSDRISVGGGGHHDHGAAEHDHASVISPHTNHELTAQAAATALAGPAYATLALGGVYSLSDDDRLATGELRLGYQLRDELRVELRGELPLGGDERTTWRARASASWRF